MCEGLDLFAEKGMIGWKGNPDGTRDIVVNVPGQACEWLREERGFYLPEFIHEMHQLDFHATTIDTAIDVRHRSVTPNKIYAWWKKGKVVCRVQIKNVGGVAGLGGWETLYAPRKWKDAEGFWRIYDKEKQVRDVLGLEIGPWTRLEYRSKGERAKELAWKLIEQGESYIGPYMKGLLDFKTTSHDVYRAPTQRWWKLAVGTDEEYLQLARGISTPETSTKWAKKQWSKTLLGLKTFVPEVLDEIFDEAEMTEEEKTEWKKFRELWRGRKDKNGAYPGG